MSRSHFIRSVAETGGRPTGLMRMGTADALVAVRPLDMPEAPLLVSRDSPSEHPGIPLSEASGEPDGAADLETLLPVPRSLATCEVDLLMPATLGVIDRKRIRDPERSCSNVQRAPLPASPPRFLPVSS